MLALYDQERDPSRDISTACGLRELLRCESAPDAGGQRGPMQLSTDAAPRARPPAGRAAQNAEDRADRQGPAQRKPRVELLPRAAVHPVLPRRPPFPARTSTAPRWRSRSVSAVASASLIRSPARRSTMISPRSLGPWESRTGSPETGAARHDPAVLRIHDVLLWTTVEPDDPPAPREPRAYGRLASPGGSEKRNRPAPGRETAEIGAKAEVQPLLPQPRGDAVVLH